MLPWLWVRGRRRLLRPDTAEVLSVGYAASCNPPHGGPISEGRVREVLRAGPSHIRVRGKSFKSFTIEGGYCETNLYDRRRFHNLNSRRFGLIGFGGLRGKGFFLHLGPTNGRWYVRPGRVDIIDGDVQLPGFGNDLPHQGTAIISRDLQSATFTLGGPPKVTGNWTCR